MGDMADYYLDALFDSLIDEYYESDGYESCPTYYAIPCDLIKETEKAMLVYVRTCLEWFPKSICIIQDGKLIAPYWLLKKKEIKVNKSELVKDY